MTLIRPWVLLFSKEWTEPLPQTPIPPPPGLLEGYYRVLGHLVKDTEMTSPPASIWTNGVAQGLIGYTRISGSLVRDTEMTSLPASIWTNGVAQGLVGYVRITSGLT
jgi:hypothetical protein